MKLIFTLGFLASFILISAQTVCIETDTITIDSIPSGLYSAEKVLSTASYIQDSSSVVLAANDSILLMPGFTVGPGASFQALNSGCQNMATLKPNVVVVNDNSDDGLIYIATDTLIFLDTVPQLNQFLNDCIITSGITDNAPLGYLRKITNVHTSGGQTTLTTQNATLSDALDFVDFNFEMDLVDPGFAPPGNVTAAKNLNAAFSFNLPDYPVNNFITLSGGITVDPDFVFELTQFEGLDEPTNFKIGTKGTISYNVDITFSPAGSANINEVIELYEKQLTPFTACIPLPPPILCFPVVIVPELEIKLILQLDGPTVEYHYENSGEFQAFLKKIGDNWTNDNTNNLTFSGGVDSFNLNLALTGAANLRLELDFDLYDLDYAEAFVFAESENIVSISTTTCTLESSINVGGGLELDFLETIGFENDQITISYPFPLGSFEENHVEILDGDGNAYTSVVIGTQEWLVENLKTTSYNNGNPITHQSSNAGWTAAGNSNSPAYCWYNNDSTTYANPYGAMYNWHAVNTGNLCPTGWHIPSHSEWTTLRNFLGGSSVAGGAIKEAGTAHWNSPNTGATNSSGFTALPGGRRETDGTFHVLGLAGSHWSTFQVGSTSARYWFVNSVESNLWQLSHPKSYGFSVRCIKD